MNIFLGLRVRKKCKTPKSLTIKEKMDEFDNIKLRTCYQKTP